MMTHDVRPADPEGDGWPRCIELVELVTAYLEDGLAADERDRVDRHLAECDGCTTYVEQFRHVLVALGRLPPEAVPDQALDRLLAAFRSARTK